MANRKIISINGSLPERSDRHWQEIFPEKDAQLSGEIIDAYRTRRESLCHRDTSVARDVAVINDFLSFSGNPIWLCTEENFEQWSSHIGLERRLPDTSYWDKT